tara:strand:- start:2205 stop:2546 length:342 start_codon:yes stop_codon:yes gene_type:complete
MGFENEFSDDVLKERVVGDGWQLYIRPEVGFFEVEMTEPRGALAAKYVREWQEINFPSSNLGSYIGDSCWMYGKPTGVYYKIVEALDKEMGIKAKIINEVVIELEPDEPDVLN